MNNDNTCEYCSAPMGTPLMRITDKYDRGETIDFYDCKNSTSCYGTKDCEEDGETCEYRPYQPENVINVTIAVVGDKLMFEDKCNGCDKRYVDVKFCPVCGRELN